ncbi:hypothetical protein BGZ46_008103, partial [Entomortierella lignicola]
MHLLRPTAFLRSAVRNVSAIPEPIRALNATSPTAFIRQNQRFTSFSSKKFYHHTPQVSAFQANAIKSAFKNNTNAAAVGLSSSSRTMFIAGATMTCVFGPLISARSSMFGSNAFSSRRVAHCAAASP